MPEKPRWQGQYGDAVQMELEPSHTNSLQVRYAMNHEGGTYYCITKMLQKKSDRLWEAAGSFTIQEDELGYVIHLLKKAIADVRKQKAYRKGGES